MDCLLCLLALDPTRHGQRLKSVGKVCLATSNNEGSYQCQVTSNTRGGRRPHRESCNVDDSLAFGGWCVRHCESHTHMCAYGHVRLMAYTQ